MGKEQPRLPMGKDQAPPEGAAAGRGPSATTDARMMEGISVVVEGTRSALERDERNTVGGGRC